MSEEKFVTPVTFVNTLTKDGEKKSILVTTANLTADPVFGSTSKGTKYVRFGLAIDNNTAVLRKAFDATDKDFPDADVNYITVFGNERLANSLERKNFKKGTRLTVMGDMLSVNDYTNKDGKSIKTLQMNAEAVINDRLRSGAFAVSGYTKDGKASNVMLIRGNLTRDLVKPSNQKDFVASSVAVQNDLIGDARPYTRTMRFATGHNELGDLDTYFVDVTANNNDKFAAADHYEKRGYKKGEPVQVLGIVSYNLSKYEDRDAQPQMFINDIRRLPKLQKGEQQNGDAPALNAAQDSTMENTKITDDDLPF